MSPRKKKVLTVRGWPNPRKGKLYKGIIKKAFDKTQYIHLIIENLDPTQLGRIHEIDLPLPIRPSKYHRTCSFLIACGIDANIDGMEIDLNHIIDTTIGMRFRTAGQDGAQQIDFERVDDTSQIRTSTPETQSVHEQLSDNMPRDEAERDF
jgi:hypothetical protein